MKRKGGNKFERRAPIDVAQRVSVDGKKAADLNLSFGEVCWLMNRSKDHQDVSMGELNWRVIPPLRLSQFRIFREPSAGPYAFMTWAFVTDEVAERLRNGDRKIEPSAWKAGKNFWIIDLVRHLAGLRRSWKLSTKACL